MKANPGARSAKEDAVLRGFKLDVTGFACQIAAITAFAIHYQLAPPTTNYKTLDPEDAG